MGYEGQFRVWRGDASDGDFEKYSVEVNEGEVVLDVIHRIQATQAPDLAVRWNCKAGKCGSCSVEINGRPRLACMTRMNTFTEEETVTVTPLRAFPVIRDLVTDVSFNYEKARAIPSFKPPADLAPGEYRMKQVDVERSQEFRKCIECFLCNDTCHVIRDHEENKTAFAGPRFLMRISELEMHPLDTADRRRVAQEEHGLGLCNITKCCSEVCPEHIKITDNALIPLKERVADLKYDPVVNLGATIPTRASRKAAKTVGTDAAAAEALALQRLHGRPADRTALAALADARHAQGNLAGAVEATRELVAASPDHGRRRADATVAHARTLLDAVEAGQLSAGSVEPELTRTLNAAQHQVSSSMTLSSLHARHAAVAGRWDEAERWIGEGSAWERGAGEQADDLLTLASVRTGQGRNAEAADALARSASAWPDNPRLAFLRPKVAIR
jgi:succinate dehydrogenase / fumarate reductase, iron-sulfur subunit